MLSPVCEKHMLVEMLFETLKRQGPAHLRVEIYLYKSIVLGLIGALLDDLSLIRAVGCANIIQQNG